MHLRLINEILHKTILSNMVNWYFAGDVLCIYNKCVFLKVRLRKLCILILTEHQQVVKATSKKYKPYYTFVFHGVWREIGVILPRRNGFTLSSLLLITSLANCSTIHSQLVAVGRIFCGWEEGRCSAVGGTVRTGMLAGTLLCATQLPSLHRKEGSGSTGRYFLFICFYLGQKGRDSYLRVIK